MAGRFQHYFRTSTVISDSTELDTTSDSALPASWYISQEMFEFERRAIFSKRWLFISHKSRLTQTGDWVRYNFASYDIIIARDRLGNINSFHNVCRHRAYPVIEKEGAGNNKILACRYHGWSYGLNGKLAKAPGYQELNLEKGENSLFRCHTKIDSNGFIWINLDTKDTPEVSWEKYFNNADTADENAHTNFDDYTFDQEFKKENGEYNWKNGPADSTPEHIKNDFNTTSTYYLPNASSTVSAKFIAIQKILPQGPNKTTKHYEIYRHKGCSEEDFKAISGAYTHAMKEEKPSETTSAFFQNTVRDAVTEHYKLEKIAGKEIWPARPELVGTAEQVDEDEEICAGLTCGPQKEVLAW